jgi:hypothetical protein
VGKDPAEMKFGLEFLEKNNMPIIDMNYRAPSSFLFGIWHSVMRNNIEIF